MGDMARCPRCQTHHYRNDPCPHEPEPEYLFDDDIGEPTGSCEHCGTNLYDDEGPLCNQCEWSVSMGASRSNEEVL